MLVTSIGIISFYSHLKFSVEFKVSYLDPYGRLQILSSRSHYCNFPHLFYLLLLFSWGFPGGLVVKSPPPNAGDTGDTVRSLGQQAPLEEEMATYSSILAWKIPSTEENGGLQSMESQRVGHNLATKQLFFHLIDLKFPETFQISLTCLFVFKIANEKIANKA